MIKAILFDANKTIEDYQSVESYKNDIFAGVAEYIQRKSNNTTLADIDNIYNFFLASYGDAFWEYHPVFWRTVVSQIWKGAFSDREVFDVYRCFLDYYVEKIKLHEDVVPTLSTLKTSYSLALVANGNSERLHRLIEKFNLYDYFSCFAISGESPSTKPDPFLFRYALNELKIKPEEAVMVGDRFATDIAGARSIGMHTIHISRKIYPTTGSCNPLLCPDADIRNLTEIPPLLTNNPTSWSLPSNAALPNNTEVTDAIVVCGGKGARMASLTTEKQKCLLPLGGIPILDYIIRSLVAVGCKRIFFTLGYLGSSVKDFIGDGKSFSIEPVFLDGPFDGTLHSVISCLPHIKGPFYYLHGNIIFPIRLLEMLWHHYSINKEPQLVTVNTSKNIRHMRIKTGDDGSVSRFFNTHDIEYFNGDLFLGAAIYDKVLFQHISGNVDNAMVEQGVEKSIASGRRVGTIPFKGLWRHYETEDDYLSDRQFTPSHLVGW